MKILSKCNEFTNHVQPICYHIKAFQKHSSTKKYDRKNNEKQFKTTWPISGFHYVIKTFQFNVQKVETIFDFSSHISKKHLDIIWHCHWRIKPHAVQLISGFLTFNFNFLENKEILVKKIFKNSAIHEFHSYLAIGTQRWRGLARCSTVCSTWSLTSSLLTHTCPSRQSRTQADCHRSCCSEAPWGCVRPMRLCPRWK